MSSPIEDDGADKKSLEDHEMDVDSRNALLRCRNKIVKDLDVKYIIDSLIESRIIDQNLYDQIKSEVKYIISMFKRLFSVKSMNIVDIGPSFDENIAYFGTFWKGAHILSFRFPFGLKITFYVKLKREKSWKIFEC